MQTQTLQASSTVTPTMAGTSVQTQTLQASSTASPTTPGTSEVTAVVAATVVFAICILALLTVCVILLWRRHSYRNRRGKITRKRSSIKMLLISEGEEWLRGPKEQRNSMTRLSLTLAQQEDPFRMTPAVSFMYDGVPISRQLAEVRRRQL